MKKGIAVLLYILLMAVFFGLDFSKLFNIRQMFFVMLGAIFLCVPGAWERGELFFPKKLPFSFDGELFGQNALWAGLIEFFILLFCVLSKERKLQYLTPELAFACRPVLYGFCIWLIFQGWNSTEEKSDVKADQSEVPLGEPEPAEEEVMKTLPEKLKEFGLTRRETEVALLLLRDFSNAEIAAELFITETTVKKHVTNIFGKTGIQARGELKERLRTGGGD